MPYDPRRAVRKGDRSLCAWSTAGCRGELPGRWAGTSWLQLDGWEQDQRGTWRKVGTGKRRRKRGRPDDRVVSIDDQPQRVSYGGAGGLRKIEGEQIFACPDHPEHLNIVTA